MSRIGNNPIMIPDGVNVQINPSELVISGKLGTLTQSYDTISVKQSDNVLSLTRSLDNNEHKSKHGLYRSCLLYTSPSPRDVEESRMPSSA